MKKKSFIFIFDQCFPGNDINPQKRLSFYGKSSFLERDFPGLKIKFSLNKGDLPKWKVVLLCPKKKSSKPKF